jgi:serine carboxypeptidase-like clade II
MRITTAVFLLTLAVLLGTSLVDASQQAQLRKFVESRITKRLGKTYTTNQLAEGTDLWADPASRFGHLPERCNIPASGSKESDKVAALPGQPTSVNFYQYAGNVKVDEEHGRELFYYFAESPYEDAASKPLLLWLNGGKRDRVMHHHALEDSSCREGRRVASFVLGPVRRAGMFIVWIRCDGGARPVPREPRRQDPEHEQERLEQR